LRIGIIGASSQVGSSIAWHLRDSGQAQVTAFLRSPAASIFFDLLGIPSAHLDFDDPIDLARALQSFDVVVDCTFPSGQLSTIRHQLRRNTRAIVAAMRPGSAYVGMSSIMAFGMAPGATSVVNHVLPCSPYARLKRIAEREASAAGRKAGVDVYLLRLGQVHGFLQAVTQSWLEKVQTAMPLASLSELPQLSNAVFPSTVAGAVRACAMRAPRPGCYTLVSNPQWRLGELIDFITTQFGPLQLEPVYATSVETTRPRGGLLLRSAKRYRHLLETYVLMELPGLGTRLKGRYRCAELRHELVAAPDHRAHDVHLLGTPPNLFPHSQSEPSRVSLAEARFRDTYESAVAAART
jgi:nucleoside-diphosphate-sugar epimerase